MGPMRDRIVVLGSLNTDFAVSVESLPRPGETVRAGPLRTFAGGKGANQAAAAARLGAETMMFGRVGEDERGHRLREGLRDNGVNVGGVFVDAGEPTGSALVLVDGRGQNMIAVSPGANRRVNQQDAARAVAAAGPTGVLLLQLEVPLDAVRAAVALGAAAGCRIVLNAAPAAELEEAILSALTVLVVNGGEASLLSGCSVDDEASARGAGARLLGLGLPNVVITLGASGSLLCNRKEAGLFRAPTVPAVDTTAAGDAFVGALAVGMAAHAELQEAVRLATLAGAAAVTREGAQDSLPDREDLYRMFGDEVMRF